MDSWFSLKTIDEKWVCQYCEATNDAAQQIAENKGSDFRASGLFKLEKKRQEGSIPVILTLLLLERTIKDFGFVYCTALKLKTEEDPEGCEVDFCVLEQMPRDSSVSIGIGECKDNNEIDDEDITHLKSVRERLLKRQLKCFLIFTKLGVGFTQAELQRFKKLHEEKVPIILLTSNELDEPMYPYRKSQDPNLPEKSAHSLMDLHRNSTYLYLK